MKEYLLAILEQPLIESTEFYSKLTSITGEEKSLSLTMSASLLHLSDLVFIETNAENESSLTSEHL